MFPVRSAVVSSCIGLADAADDSDLNHVNRLAVKNQGEHGAMYPLPSSRSNKRLSVSNVTARFAVGHPAFHYWGEHATPIIEERRELTLKYPSMTVSRENSAGSTKKEGINQI